MPYFIYKVFRKPILRLEKIEQHDHFRVASDRIKILRPELTVIEPCEVRMIFADNEFGAEDMLSQIREPVPEIDDD